ncbi:Atp-Citrate Synthase [Manis pentadactyla]|nr:Atp-Citrate Synthase [Manis pentadactyla]
MASWGGSSSSRCYGRSPPALRSPFPPEAVFRSSYAHGTPGLTTTPSPARRAAPARTRRFSAAPGRACSEMLPGGCLPFGPGIQGSEKKDTEQHYLLHVRQFPQAAFLAEEDLSKNLP